MPYSIYLTKLSRRREFWRCWRLWKNFCHSFHVYWPILVKFGAQLLHLILWVSVNLMKIWRSERRALLVGLSQFLSALPAYVLYKISTLNAAEPFWGSRFCAATISLSGLPSTDTATCLLHQSAVCLHFYCTGHASLCLSDFSLRTLLILPLWVLRLPLCVTLITWLVQ